MRKKKAFFLVDKCRKFHRPMGIRGMEDIQMCQKEEIPPCFGLLYSDKDADCQGSHKRQRCLLCTLCYQQQRLHNEEKATHKLAVATLAVSKLIA